MSDRVPVLGAAAEVPQRGESPMAKASRLASLHWGYVADTLRAHGVTDEEIELCGYHYRTAFVHGYKHAREDLHA